MAGVELATAYLTLVPSLRGASKTIAAQLGGVDVSKAGEKIGKSLTDSIGKAFDTSSVTAFETSVRAAEKGVRDAMEGTEQATKKVAIAQQELDQAREKYGDSSTQAQKAELRLAQAQQQAARAAANEADAQTKLERAEMELEQATRAANTAQAMQESILGRVSSAAGTASAKLATASQALSNAGSRIQSAGSVLTAGVTVPAVAATAAIGKFALGTASAAETTEISFTTMLGSAEAAESMMADLSDFATKTPFELSGLQSATRQLLAYGFTADEIIPMLTNVGDATAALGTGQYGIEAVTRALGQMQTRGKVSAEEMLQLTEQGIPAWEYLARAIGTDTAGAMQAVTDGAISASEGIAAITKGMEEDFGGMMESQSKTVQGLMSNLSDAIERPLMALRDTDAYEHFADALAKVVDSAGPFVESLLPHMEKGIDGVAGILNKASDAMDSFANMSEEGQANIISLATAAIGAGPALTLVGTGAKAAGALMGGASKLLGAGSRQLEKVAAAAAEAAAQATANATATGAMASGADKAAKSSGKLNSALGLLKGGLAALGIGAAVALVGSLAAAFSKASDHANDMEVATSDLSEAIAGTSGTSLSVSADDAAKSMASLTTETADTFAEIESKSSMLEGYVGTIERLADKSDLTAREQAELKEAVEGYNEITGDTVGIVDAVNGKLDTSTQMLRDNAKAWEDNIRAQQLLGASQSFFEEGAGYESQISELEKYFEQNPEAPGFTLKLGGFELYSGSQQAEWEEKKRQLEELIALQESAYAKSDALSAQYQASVMGLAESLQTALAGLPDSMQAIGLDVATNLAAGVSSGTVTANEAANFLTLSVGGVLAALPPEAQAKGAEAVSSLASAISSGQISVSQAVQILKAAITGQVSTLPPELQPYGTQVAQSLGSGIELGAMFAGSSTDALISAIDGSLMGLPADMEADGSDGSQSFAGGIESGEPDVSSASSTLANATEGVKANNGSAYAWGSEMGSNFASGIASSYGAVASAAASIAAAAAAPLHHSTPDIGPLRHDDEWGYELGENIAEGMNKAVPLVERMSNRMAEAVTFGSGFASLLSAKRTAFASKRPFDIGFGKIDQQINFNQPVKTPAQTAAMMKRYATYGLAGAR